MDLASGALAGPTANSSANLITQIPTEMRVLVVDDDAISLSVLKMCLLKCGYHVTTCNQGAKALSMLRKNRSAYDIVMLDVHMPEMNGLQVLEILSLEMDLPVVMISGDSSEETVMEGVKHGACDYLTKPFSVNQIRNLWQHVVRSRNAAQNKRKRDGENSDSSNESSKKKHRMKWSTELHQKFINTVKEIGINKVVPKRILELMDVPGLTKEQVSSHLQKFREYLKQAAGVQRPNQIPEDILSNWEAQKLGPANNNCPEVETTMLPNLLAKCPIMNQKTMTTTQTQNVTSSQEMMNYSLVCQNSKGCSLPLMESYLSSSNHSPMMQQAHDPGLTSQELEANVQPTGKDTSATANEVGSSYEYNYNDGDDILQEEFLVRLFNSSDDDAFL